MRLNNYTAVDYVCLSIYESEVAGFGFFFPVLDRIADLFDILAPRKLQVPTFDGSVELGCLDNKVLLLAALVMTTVFDGVHCMAWSFAFRNRCYGARVLSL
ncbi:uncharacterized protein F5147DRAFT_704046 [Suillus discolor]|uniref:Uncharacterized protein n=1 Tax=Suillus discolor TaxID=1912936 RepID=A0A9P7JS73_9AGAM|nr:uncharacterized protein F5147DRAFT_704046 [Suillus discolor]KAG2104355.1 hypothetical protein F5147DRAFT_704046 [Suillus discolor]